MSAGLKIGVVGATGVVGLTFLNLLEKHPFKIQELRLFASAESEGKKLSCRNTEWPVKALAAKCFEGLDLVFFSSGDPISKEWAPQAVASGAWAVDNSAAWRMDRNTFLVVPEVNGHLLKDQKPQIIANPNCSTIQLVVALKPLMDNFGIEDVKVSSYQSVSGAGTPGMVELADQMKQWAQFSDLPFQQQLKRTSEMKGTAFSRPILFNAIPEIGSFDESGFTSEEKKIMNETRKIMGLPQLSISAFTVRVPSLIGHSETVWCKLKKDVSFEEISSAFEKGEGIKFEKTANKFFTSLDSAYQEPVYVSRVHKDPNDPKTWLFWVVADNVYKGAALNGLQIAEKIFPM